MSNLERAKDEIEEICKKSKNISQFFRYGGSGYLSSVRHYFETSSEVASAAVEPGSAEDLGEIIKVLAKYPDVKFAVKGGGHSTNPGFSSTEGIQISMSRFNTITYNQPVGKEPTLSVESGCLFDEIYRVIWKENRNIVGGSPVDGVGIGGYLLGGGYSLHTNQYGLGIDNIEEIKIVLPSGKSVIASEQVETELFTNVKGGGNNFGIVTEFTLKTFPQGAFMHEVLLFEQPGHIDRAKKAITTFIDSSKDKPKAAIVCGFRYYRRKEFKLTVEVFYDGEVPSPSPFEMFFSVPPDHQAKDPHPSMIKANLQEVNRIFAGDGEHLPEETPMVGVGEINSRARWGCTMVSTYTPRLVDEIEKQSWIASQFLDEHNGQTVHLEVWPFIPSMFDHSPPAAWPHYPGKPNGMLNVHFRWEGKENDDFWIGKMKDALKALEKVAVEDGVHSGPIYANTTLGDTPVEKIYGEEQLKKLGKIRAKYDPNDVMGGAGGFRIPLIKGD